jgi:hypothetical protein
VRLIRALDPSDIRRRQQSVNEHPHLLGGGHGLSSRPLPPNIHTTASSHGLSGAHQYPSSHYDTVKVEEDYIVGQVVHF